MKKHGMLILSLYYIIFFMHQGFGALLTRYMYLIGFSEKQVGVLTSVPFLLAMCLLPMFGTVTDRLPKKKYLLIVLSVFAGGLLLFIDGFTDFTMIESGQTEGATRFLPFFIVLVFSTIFVQAVQPAMNSIGIEYTASVHKEYGPVRMCGTAGYLLGTLIIGQILAKSLRYAYSWQGLVLLFSGIFAVLLPDIRGHQHGNEKVSPLVLLKDRKMLLLLGMILTGTVTTMFFGSFNGIYMEQMGISNSLMTILLFIGASLEIPALLLSKKLLKRFNMWQWILIGYILCGIRWILLFAAMALQIRPLVIPAQLLGVSSMMTFEFFPQQEVGRTIKPELSGSAQTLLNVFIFGVPRIFGSLLGGVLCSRFGVGNMYLFWGLMLLTAAAAFFPAVKRITKENVS